MSGPENRAPVMSSRLVLVAGFGGLLLLMVFAGFDGLQALRQIQASDNNIREGFLLRTRVLERIRADVYVSGTYVRDYLLEPESGKAEGHRYSLRETRSDMDTALRQYQALLNAQEAEPFQVLTRELAAYWTVMDHRTAAARRLCFSARRSFPAAHVHVGDRGPDWRHQRIPVE